MVYNKNKQGCIQPFCEENSKRVLKSCKWLTVLLFGCPFLFSYFYTQTFLHELNYVSKIENGFGLWLVGYQLGRDDGVVSLDTVPATASKLSRSNRGYKLGPALL